MFYFGMIVSCHLLNKIIVNITVMPRGLTCGQGLIVLGTVQMYTTLAFQSQSDEKFIQQLGKKIVSYF